MIYIKRKISKGQTPKDRLEWKQASEYWTKESPVARGNNFNKTVREADIYDYHEIFLENGKRLDSYDPDAGEIISRKATDLDKISEETYRRYLSEFSSKYSEGTKIRSNAWDNITSTADNMPATKIPATFKIDLDGNINYVNPETGTNTLWTNSNATKHMGEYVSRFGDESWSIGTRSQAMLESYSASLNKAMETIGTETPGRYFGTYGNWELGINTETGVVYHARMIN